MKKFFDEQYKPKSGNTVKLQVDFIPWPDFYTRVNASLTSGERKYNFIVSDSQWLGAFVEGGYFRRISGRSSSGGFWSRKVKNALSFNED